jgi:hypothetical protein
MESWNREDSFTDPFKAAEISSERETVLIFCHLAPFFWRSHVFFFAAWAPRRAREGAYAPRENRVFKQALNEGGVRPTNGVNAVGHPARFFWVFASCREAGSYDKISLHEFKIKMRRNRNPHDERKPYENKNGCHRSKEGKSENGVTVVHQAAPPAGKPQPSNRSLGPGFGGRGRHDRRG